MKSSCWFGRGAGGRGGSHGRVLGRWCREFGTLVHELRPRGPAEPRWACGAVIEAVGALLRTVSDPECGTDWRAGMDFLELEDVAVGVVEVAGRAFADG